MDNLSVRSYKTPYLPKYSLWVESPTSAPEPTITPNHYVSYPYEPKVVKLTGTVVNVQAHGAPGFGEDAKHDQKVTYYLLKLNKPINVKGNPDSDTNVDDFENVKEMEIELDTDDSLRTFLNKNVVIEGTLSQRLQGTEITDVLIGIDSIKKIKIIQSK
jgi:hypothetical protein